MFSNYKYYVDVERNIDIKIISVLYILTSGLSIDIWAFWTLFLSGYRVTLDQAELKSQCSSSCMVNITHAESLENLNVVFPELCSIIYTYRQRERGRFFFFSYSFYFGRKEHWRSIMCSTSKWGGLCRKPCLLHTSQCWRVPGLWSPVCSLSLTPLGFSPFLMSLKPFTHWCLYNSLISLLKSRPKVQLPNPCFHGNVSWTFQI